MIPTARKMHKIASTDALTSVKSRNAYVDYIQDLQDELDSVGNFGFALGVFDCDNLKSVNDQYGHGKGDAYLKNVCRLICRVFQHSPVFRIGGDEFAVILRNDDYRYREDLVASFEKASAETRENQANPWDQVHVAMGIAEFDPAQDHSVIDTMRRADKMMYTNKRKNKAARQDG